MKDQIFEKNSNISDYFIDLLILMSYSLGFGINTHNTNENGIIYMNILD